MTAMRAYLMGLKPSRVKTTRTQAKAAHYARRKAQRGREA